jgi:hypothetical protein
MQFAIHLGISALSAQGKKAESERMKKKENIRGIYFSD